MLSSQNWLQQFEVILLATFFLSDQNDELCTILYTWVQSSRQKTKYWIKKIKKKLSFREVIQLGWIFLLNTYYLMWSFTFHLSCTLFATSWKKKKKITTWKMWHFAMGSLRFEHITWHTGKRTQNEISRTRHNRNQCPYSALSSRMQDRNTPPNWQHIEETILLPQHNRNLE